MASQERTCHGNPTVLFSAPIDAAGAALSVTPADGDQPVWVSQRLLAVDDAVRVDAWNGAFVGDLLGAVILPEGTYQAALAVGDAPPMPVETLRVVGSEVFHADFAAGDRPWDDPNGMWHEDGSWSADARGIAATDGAAYLFSDGNMYGVLEAVFELTGAADAEWGLIARHYSDWNHQRILFSRSEEAENSLEARLVMVHGMPPETRGYRLVARGIVPLPDDGQYRVTWRLYGQRHELLVNGRRVLLGQEPATAGVTVTGLLSETPDVRWSSFAMTTTQPVPLYEVARAEYGALLRPGNIHRLYLRKSDTPEQNLCWESGIQFGHIGGSELKYTQAGRLTPVVEGPTLTQVRWDGPMPKFVDGSEDNRGQARGIVSFYPDRIVLADYVVTWVRRSVGPDFDLRSRLMNGPARIARHQDAEFSDWAFPTDGRFTSLGATTCGETYPLAIAFPYLLGGRQWWLKAVLGNLVHVDGDRPASIFGWVCPRRLTASHDFRSAPTEPGIEYGFSIAVVWEASDDRDAVERDLRNLQEDWFSPMIVTPSVGSITTYDKNVEVPRKAISFDGCFDRATGLYHVAAADKEFSAELDTGGIARRSAAFAVTGVDRDDAITCTLGGRTLTLGADMSEQIIDDRTRLILVTRPIDQPAALSVVRSP